MEVGDNSPLSSSSPSSSTNISISSLLLAPSSPSSQRLSSSSVFPPLPSLNPSPPHSPSSPPSHSTTDTISTIISNIISNIIVNSDIHSSPSSSSRLSNYSPSHHSLHDIVHTSPSSPLPSSDTSTLLLTSAESPPFVNPLVDSHSPPTSIASPSPSSTSCVPDVQSLSLFSTTTSTSSPVKSPPPQINGDHSSNNNSVDVVASNSTNLSNGKTSTLNNNNKIYTNGKTANISIKTSINANNSNENGTSYKSSNGSKKVYRYDRDTMYALAPSTPLPRPADIPLHLCRDEPGNVSQEMIAKRTSGSQNSFGDLKNEGHYIDGDIKNSEQHSASTSNSSPVIEIRSDDIVLGPPPRKPFPSSSVPSPTLAPPKKPPPFSDLNDFSSSIRISKTKSRKVVEDLIISRSQKPMSSQLLNGKGFLQSNLRTSSTKSVRIEGLQNSSELVHPPLNTETFPSPSVTTAAPATIQETKEETRASILELLGVHAIPESPIVPKAVNPPLPSYPNELDIPLHAAHYDVPPPITTFYVQPSTSQLDVDVDSFFAPGNDDAAFQQIFRKQFVHSNHSTAVDSAAVVSNQVDTTKSSIPSDPLPELSHVNNLIPPPDDQQIEEETGEVLLSRGFGRWFSDTAQVTSPAVSFQPLNVPATSTSFDPSSFGNQTSQIPVDQPFASFNNIESSTSIDVLLRNAFLAYEERNSTPQNSPHPMSSSPYNPHDSSFPHPAPLSTINSNSSPELTLPIPNPPGVDPELTPMLIPSVADSSNHAHSPSGLVFADQSTLSPSTTNSGTYAHLHSARHVQSHRPTNKIMKPNSVQNKRPPYNSNSSTPNNNHVNNNNNRKKTVKDGHHKVTGLLAPPTQPPQAFFVNFNHLQPPSHHFALSSQPMQTFFVPQHLPPHAQHINHPPPHVHHPQPPPVPLPPPNLAVGLEKWFGPTLMAHTAHDVALPSIPPKVRVHSVQEIENQMATSSPSQHHHSHHGHHNNNNNHSHSNNKH